MLFVLYSFFYVFFSMEVLLLAVVEMTEVVGMEAFADRPPPMAVLAEIYSLAKIYSLVFVLMILQEVLEVFSVFLNLLVISLAETLAETKQQKLMNSLKKLYRPYLINLEFHRIHFVW